MREGKTLKLLPKKEENFAFIQWNFKNISEIIVKDCFCHLVGWRLVFSSMKTPS